MIQRLRRVATTTFVQVLLLLVIFVIRDWDISQDSAER